MEESCMNWSMKDSLNLHPSLLPLLPLLLVFFLFDFVGAPVAAGAPAAAAKKEEPKKEEKKEEEADVDMGGLFGDDY